MDETLDVWLPPWFAISSSALRGSNLKKILTFIDILIKTYSTQNGCGQVCASYVTWLPVSLWKRVLSRDSFLHYSICPTNWSIKLKTFWLKGPIHNFLSYTQWYVYVLCMLNNISITFGHKLNKFQPLKLFFRNFSLSANLV